MGLGGAPSLVGTGGGRVTYGERPVRDGCGSECLAKSSPILAFRTKVGMRLTRISTRDRNCCACTLYWALSLRARSVTRIMRLDASFRRGCGLMGFLLSSCKLSIRACFWASVRPTFLLLIGLLCGVLVGDVDDLRFLGCTGAMLFVPFWGARQVGLGIYIDEDGTAECVRAKDVDIAPVGVLRAAFARVRVGGRVLASRTSLVKLQAMCSSTIKCMWYLLGIVAVWGFQISGRMLLKVNKVPCGFWRYNRFQGAQEGRLARASLKGA